MRGKMLKSVIRVGFQERRLQYMEKEQINLWKQQRAGERLLEIDFPLSYGVYDVVNDPESVNVCEFLWNPTKETGVFIRVNSISTEFTPKKHGGEKGVPFRVQIETYSQDEETPQILHAASCQVKVFKPKGADRKHKTDREKMGKRPQSEQEKFQPSYDCTVFTECTFDALYRTSSVAAEASVPSSAVTTATSAPTTNTTTSTTSSTQSTTQQQPTCSSPPQSTNTDSKSSSLPPIEQNPGTPGSNASDLQEIIEVAQGPFLPLSSEASAAETAQWLQLHRFTSFVRTFSSFSGSDILRLTRDDLIQICGLADGIRLYNVLHCRSIRPRLVMYVCISSESVFRAIYLENLIVTSLTSKLAALFTLPAHAILDTYVQGPSGIHILLTNEVIQNFSEEATYTAELLQDQSSDLYHILLKPYSHQ